MSKKDVPFVNSDGEAVIIHNRDHGNSKNHENPHAHDVNIPKNDDEDYLDKGRPLTEEENKYNNEHKND